MTADPKKKGLGRGLSALLPGGPVRSPTPASPAPPLPAAAPASASPSITTQPSTAGTANPASTAASSNLSTPSASGTGDKARTYFLAGIEQLFPGPEQPRRTFTPQALDELATSIRVHGIIMPLVVRPRPNQDGYFIIAGERRWRAAQRAGLHDVPVVVQHVAPQAAFERALVENVQRADLSPIEEAEAYARLASEFALTHEQIAAKVGKDRSTIANAVRLLKLPASVRQWLEDGTLSMGHARALLALPTEAAIESGARTVIQKGLSVRATEALAKPTPKSSAAKSGASRSAKSAAVLDLQERLTRSVGGQVEIVEDAPGKGGAITIRYQDLNHLDRLLDRLL